ncbi:dnaJ homolog subfamily C member 10-like [Bacillus rossius redtenbacheri]|uniref:dnaJ homolog subfamily C member 10-like n=1 Tax=Bacillus rossius redtenbacheri TaxID=93214 RepID=UPI002FDD40EF
MFYTIDSSGGTWLFVLLILCTFTSAKDFYELLDVPKDADKKTIRQAYKKLAVTFHPDKNKDDPESHEKFLLITTAYETLKDDELRKKYDLYGKAEPSTKKQTYHSWSYYEENFGIYDNDPEIVNLDAFEFEQSVASSVTRWFVNFYSPLCSHCHDMAPEWRKLAIQADGAIRIGAVNCADEWQLCNQQGVRSYPSLIMYPSRIKYTGNHRFEEMLDFVLGHIQAKVSEIDTDIWKKINQQQKANNQHSWLIFLCKSQLDCKDDHHILVAAMLENFVSVGVINCRDYEELCSSFQSHTDIILWTSAVGNANASFHSVESLEPRDITIEVLGYLPDIKLLEEDSFEDMRMQLRLGSSTAWLVYFFLGNTHGGDTELKKLPALLPNIHIAKVNCARMASVCGDLNINRYPLFAVFKQGGGHEIHHGLGLAHDVATFVKESSAAINVRILSPREFHAVVDNGDDKMWFIDFYAPWCPPCLRLLPEFRKASQLISMNVNFGTVDCTAHRELCSQNNINSYPTTVLYNNSVKYQFFGEHTASSLIDFIKDIISPTVISLTSTSFYQHVAQKDSGELWLVDFFAPWCHACQELAPQWRKLAKMVSGISNVNIGEVNCEVELSVCSDQGVRMYPSVRLYPFGSVGLSTLAVYNGHRSARALYQWLFNFIPSSVEQLDPSTFDTLVLQSKDAWLVDFYAPWCGHCVTFAPEFEILSQWLKGRVRAGKLDCDKYYQFCHKCGVVGYPTVKLYTGDSRSHHGEEIPSQSKDYILSHVNNVLDSSNKVHNLHDEF